VVELKFFFNANHLVVLDGEAEVCARPVNHIMACATGCADPTGVGRQQKWPALIWSNRLIVAEIQQCPENTASTLASNILASLT